MPSKRLFIERDGALLQPPAGSASRGLARFALMPGVIAALQRFRAAGYSLVILAPADPADGPSGAAGSHSEFDAFTLALLDSQGIAVEALRACRHTDGAACDCRKPALGLVRDFLADPRLDRERSAVIGADAADLELAANMGLPGFRIGATADGGIEWSALAHRLLDAPRIAQVHRKTRETDITVSVDLDREAEPRISTGIGFFDHMLEQLGKHGGFALAVDCSGDLEVDEHHTVEDVALTLGQALARALGDKRGIGRYGFLLPMDEARVEVAIDLSGRAYFVFEGEFERAEVGGLPTELVPHFFRSLSDTLGAAIHLRVQGENSHHKVEACFKGVARALRQALARAGDELPSTKGQL